MPRPSTPRPLTPRIEQLHAHAGVEHFNIGHRGARAFAPENTLEAFAKAVQLGCHMVELDVHMTRDAVPIVHHDDDLLRCTDAVARFPGLDSYFISDFTTEQIASLDGGSWFAAQLSLPAAQRQPFLRGLMQTETSQQISPCDLQRYASGAVRVPTLAQVCALLEASPLLINVEIKSLPRMYAGITTQVIDCVRRHGLEHRTLLSSFDHEQLVTARAASAQLATAVLTSDRLAMPRRYLELLDADAFHPSCSGEQDSLGFNSAQHVLQLQSVHAVRAAGKDVNTWTCNDAARMEQLLDGGITGIFTDYPNRLAQVLAHA